MANGSREEGIRVDLRLTGRVAAIIREALIRRKGEELSPRDIGKEIKKGVVFLANEGFFEYENPFEWLEDKAKEYLGLEEENKETEEVKRLLEELKAVVEQLEKLGVPVQKVINLRGEEKTETSAKGEGDNSPLVGFGNFAPPDEGSNRKKGKTEKGDDDIKISIDF